MKLLAATLLHIFGFSLVFIGADRNVLFFDWHSNFPWFVFFMIALGIIDIIISFSLFYLCYKEHKENKK